MSNLHELKTWPSYFQAILDGDKTFEVRRDDRGFHAGDTLRLREWEPKDKRYTGRTVDVRVTYLLEGGEALTPGFCVMGIESASYDELEYGYTCQAGGA